MDFFEMFSHTAWPEIALVYTLVLGYLLQYILGSAAGLGSLLLYLVSCTGVWVLTEYLLHMFLFHSEGYCLNRWAWFRRLHFCIHGIHHVLPLDRERILFPPIMGLPILYLILRGLQLAWPDPFPQVILAGIISGYCCYDLWHYAMHNVKRNSFLAHLRYHNRHHFAPFDGNYGVTTDLFDRLFGTTLPPL